MANKRFRAGAYRYTIRKKILPKPIYLTFHDEQEGDKYVYKLEKLLEKGIIPEGFEQAEKRTLGAVISQYQDMVSVKPDDNKLLNKIHTEYKNVSLDDISYHWAEGWITKMKRVQNLSPGTIRHYVGALARCLDWALAKEFIKTNPLRQLPRGYAQYNELDARHAPKRDDIAKDRRLEEGEEELIRNSLSGELLLFFEIALQTGMRLSEIYSLTPEQIDIDRKTIHLPKTKNGKSRNIPMSTTLVDILKSQEVTGYEKNPKNTARFSKQFARIAPDGVTFHTLRHEFCSRLFERTDLTLYEIQKIMGHSSLKMLDRYTHLRVSDIAEKLW